MAIEKALQLAKEAELDLAEVAPNVNPPVCKILDYGKYRYHQKKVETKHRKSQKKREMKGVRVGFKTGEHDMKVKENQARKFLIAKHSVKIHLLFKGREAAYKDIAKEKLLNFAENLKDVSGVELEPKKTGNIMIMILNPKENYKS